MQDKSIETLRAKAKGKFGPRKISMPEGGSGFDQAMKKTTNVGEIAAEMMGEDSALTRLAKTQGAQAANSRGFLNSSMAEGAKMDAIAAAITPLAQQEASQRQTEKMSGIEHRQAQELQSQQGDIASGLSAQEAEQQSQQAEQTFGFNQALSEQESQQRQAEAAQTNEFNVGLATMQNENDRQLQQNEIFAQKELAVLDANSRENLMQMEADMRTNLARIDVSAQDRVAMTGMVETMHQIYQGNLQTILANPDMSADDRNALLASSGEFLKEQTALIEGIYGVSLDWANGTIDVGSTGSETDDEAEATTSAQDDDDDDDYRQAGNYSFDAAAAEIANNRVSPNTIY